MKFLFGGPDEGQPHTIVHPMWKGSLERALGILKANGLTKESRAIAQRAAQLNFNAQDGRSLELAIDCHGAHTLTLLGMGDAPHKRSGAQAKQSMAAAASRYLESRRISRGGALLGVGGGTHGTTATDLILGARLGLYKFGKIEHKLDQLNIMPCDAHGRLVAPSVDSDWANAIADGVIYARDLMNMSPGDKQPGHIEEMCEKIAADSDGLVTLTCVHEPELKELGAGCLLAVGAGSPETPDRRPRILVLTYTGPGWKSGDPVYWSVDKTITFDTGGLGIKPAGSMSGMKFDLGGGAVGMGTSKALSVHGELPLKYYAVLVVTENNIGPNATPPDTVAKSMLGKTAKIDHTDAEGRLAVLDGLGWVVKQMQMQGIRPSSQFVMVDATMTGASCVVAGNDYALMYCGDDALKAQMLRAAQISGDRMHWMPGSFNIARKLQETGQSGADFKNIVGHGYKWGGATHPYEFLMLGVGKNGPTLLYRDIAPVASLDAPTPWAHLPKQGGTGFGVASRLEFLRAR